MTDEVLSTAAQDQLKTIVDRIENLANEKAEIQEQIKEVLEEAAGNGFDKSIIRAIVRMRKKSIADRQNERALLDLYLEAIGEAV